MRVAIIGGGVAGLTAAWLLRERYDIALYEAEARLGGHSNTASVRWQGEDWPVDTGFIVFNERNYPNLCQLFDQLGVASHASDMSFGVSVDGGRIEYAGTSLATLFAQRRNLVRPGFHRMLADILRFNAQGRRWLADTEETGLSLGDFLAAGRYGSTFREHYLLPMAAAIWSAALTDMLRFPARSFLRFFANHGLLSIHDRPLWRTVTGGAKVYVERISESFQSQVRAGCPVQTVLRWPDHLEVIDAAGRRDYFDQVVLACHADQALAIIDRPTAAEQAILGSFDYRANRAVLHQDPRLMPRRRAVWSSWNYFGGAGCAADQAVSVTYWLNQLQAIPDECLALVSLNPFVEPDPAKVIGEYRYDHPQFTFDTLSAQARLPEIQGRDGLWFCGAHWGYGFHEDGCLSGLQVAAALGVQPAWWSNVVPLHPAPRESLPAAVGASSE